MFCIIKLAAVSADAVPFTELCDEVQLVSKQHVGPKKEILLATNT